MEKRRLRFVTMFPRIENIHIVKDVGMIPYAMRKYYNYDSKIVIYKNKKYDFLENDVKIPKMYFPDKKFNSKLNCIKFLLKNSKNIDVLHVFHIFQKTTLLSIPIFLFKNPNGYIYIHMDSNVLEYKNNDVFLIEGKGIKTHLRKFIYKHIIFSKKNRKKILFGMQDCMCEEKLKNVFPFDNIKYIPDGYERLSNSEKEIDKENIILFVGRVGSNQKRTDILLDGFRKAYAKIGDWKLKLIGPIENDFKEYVDLYIKKYPFLKEKIIVVGPIYDREKLEDEYRKTKIFCLTSDYESFGLVLVEALYNKCMVISTDIPSSREIINNGEFGYLFEKGNSEDLANKIIEACKDEKKRSYVMEHSQEYIRDNYSYENNLKPLNNWIINNVEKENEKNKK